MFFCGPEQQTPHRTSKTFEQLSAESHNPTSLTTRQRVKSKSIRHRKGAHGARRVSGNRSVGLVDPKPLVVAPDPLPLSRNLDAPLPRAKSQSTRSAPLSVKQRIRKSFQWARVKEIERPSLSSTPWPGAPEKSHSPISLFHFRRKR